MYTSCWRNTIVKGVAPCWAVWWYSHRDVIAVWNNKLSSQIVQGIEVEERTIKYLGEVLEDQSFTDTSIF